MSASFTVRMVSGVRVVMVAARSARWPGPEGRSSARPRRAEGMAGRARPGGQPARAAGEEFPVGEAGQQRPRGRVRGHPHTPSRYGGGQGGPGHHVDRCEPGGRRRAGFQAHQALDGGHAQSFGVRRGHRSHPAAHGGQRAAQLHPDRRYPVPADAGGQRGGDHRGAVGPRGRHSPGSSTCVAPQPVQRARRSAMATRPRSPPPDGSGRVPYGRPRSSGAARVSFDGTGPVWVRTTPSPWQIRGHANTLHPYNAPGTKDVHCRGRAGSDRSCMDWSRADCGPGWSRSGGRVWRA